MPGLGLRSWARGPNLWGPSFLLGPRPSHWASVQNLVQGLHGFAEAQARCSLWNFSQIGNSTWVYTRERLFRKPAGKGLQGLKSKRQGSVVFCAGA